MRLSLALLRTELRELFVGRASTGPCWCWSRKVYLDAILDAPVSGQVGLWSKTDTVVVFDRFTVSPAP